MMNFLRYAVPLLLLAAAPRAPGAAVASDAQPTVVTSDRLEMRSSGPDTVSVCDGHVVVTATGLRLTCDHLEVISTRVGDKEDTVGKQDRFKSLVATGHVKIKQGEREAECARAEVDPRAEKITLTGNPIVTDRGNGTVATGEPLVMLRAERRVTGENVKITMPSLRNLGFDPKQAPPAPDAPAAKTPPAEPLK